ncbi:MAG: hypothetical protein ACRD5E_14100 [Nitrososphaeraceae archaeon]
MLVVQTVLGEIESSIELQGHPKHIKKIVMTGRHFVLVTLSILYGSPQRSNYLVKPRMNSDVSISILKQCFISQESGICLG